MKHVIFSPAEDSRKSVYQFRHYTIMSRQTKMLNWYYNMFSSTTLYWKIRKTIAHHLALPCYVFGIMLSPSRLI